MALASIRKNLEAFEAAVEKGKDLQWCASALVELKIALTSLPALQPGAAITSALFPEIALARDVYEVAALLSVKQGDDAAFERHVAQAKTYYVDYAAAVPASARQNLILALNLMRLMVQNRIAEFHTELELIAPAARTDACIAYALRLENYLMEGSYSKLRDEKGAVPHAAFEYFVDKLMVTVREEIAACSARAYDKLPVKPALRLLALKSQDELEDFADDHGWRIADGVIHFSAGDDGGLKMENVPSDELIRRTLDYARELEQII